MSDNESKAEVDGLSFTLRFDEESIKVMNEELKEMLFPEDMFAPKTIVDDAPEALFVEFGTGPSKYHKSKPTPGDRRTDITREKVEYNGRTYMMTPTEKKFFEWAKRKWPGEDAVAVGHNVYRKVMEEGMPPQPFFRPAMYKVWNDPGFEDIVLTEGTQGVAERIVEEAKRILMESTTDSNSPLVRGLRIIDGEDVSGATSMNDMDPSVWQQRGSSEYDWPDRYGVHRAKHYHR